MIENSSRVPAIKLPESMLKYLYTGSIFKSVVYFCNLPIKIQKNIVLLEIRVIVEMVQISPSAPLLSNPEISQAKHDNPMDFCPF